MAAPDWSFLPEGLVNRVADCLLATNDLDYYMDLRAVCHHWRSVTDDPRSKSNQQDPRFRPSRWVMLDEHKVVASYAINVDSDFLFVNTATGRFLRRSLPLVRDFIFVTSTTDGLLVLAARDSTPMRAARVVNPFTGSLIRFAAPVPDKSPVFTAEVVGPSPTLVMLNVAPSDDVYWADPQSESFSVESHHNHPAGRLPLIAAIVANKHSGVVGREPDSEDNKMFDKLLYCEGCRCYVVRLPLAAGGDMFAVLKVRNFFAVLKLDAAGNYMGRVTSIGSLALFLGVRCFAVDADCFPTIEPNCIYFQASADNANADGNFIYKVDIIAGTIVELAEPELVEEAADYSITELGVAARGAPFTVTQILSNYTMSLPFYYRSLWRKGPLCMTPAGNEAE